MFQQLDLILKMATVFPHLHRPQGSNKLELDFQISKHHLISQREN